MKLVIIILTLSMTIFPYGCQQKENNQTTFLVETTETTYDLNNNAKAVTIESDNIEVLNSGITLSQIECYLNFEGFDGFDKNNSEYWKIFNGLFEVYNCSDIGVELFRIKDSNDSKMTFVECDPSIVSLLGINKDMNFQEIQNCISSTNIVKVKHGLSNIISYELWYIINGVKIKFIAWDQFGEESWTLKFVKNFDPLNDYVRLSIEYISAYFSMNKQEMSFALGSEAKYNEKQETFILNGLKFVFYGDDLLYIDFTDNYEMAGIRQYYYSDRIQSILGEREIKFLGGEDAFYGVNYEYSNFNIDIVYSSSEDGLYHPFSIGIKRNE